MVLPKRKITSMSEFVQAFPEVKRVIIDGTERPIQRAKNQDLQKQDYSGKKKRHTRNQLAAVDPDKRIMLLSVSYQGKRHDKGILNQEEWVEYIPDEVEIQGDLGFQGLQNEYENVEIPHKKPKGGELSEKQKADATDMSFHGISHAHQAEENRNLASERVVCEHGFSGVKRYGIAANVYRNRIPNFDDRSMLTAVGLWNFYLMAA